MNEVSSLVHGPQMNPADLSGAKPAAAGPAVEVEPFGGLGLLVALCGGLWPAIALAVGSVI